MNYGKVYFKYPKDPQVKNHYYKLSREYNKLKKRRYREYKQSLLDKIEALHEDNPKMYWRLIDELRRKEISQNIPAVEPSDWLSHFQNLNDPKPQFLDKIKVLDSQLSKMEKEKCFTELDNTISKSEISNAIGKIKNEKSHGLDRVSIKMIKHSQTIVLPILHKHF